jgi:hypothetical protein
MLHQDGQILLARRKLESDSLLSSVRTPAAPGAGSTSTVNPTPTTR